MPIVQVSKKVITVCSDGYLEFGVKNWHRGVKIYYPGQLFFFFDSVDPSLTYGRSSNFRHWTGGG